MILELTLLQKVYENEVFTKYLAEMTQTKERILVNIGEGQEVALGKSEVFNIRFTVKEKAGRDGGTVFAQNITAKKVLQNG